MISANRSDGEILSQSKLWSNRIMKIAVASEHRGFKSKDKILSLVRELNHDGVDFGPTTDEMCDYPDYASKAARAVSSGEVDRAILIGGTGIGMTIVANKFRDVRAALCHDVLSAQISRSHNNANILCLSVDLIATASMPLMIQTWIDTPFEGGRHERRVEKISQYEREIFGLVVRDVENSNSQKQHSSPEGNTTP